MMRPLYWIAVTRAVTLSRTSAALDEVDRGTLDCHAMSRRLSR